VGLLAIAVQDIHTDPASAPTTIRAGFLLHFRTPGYGPSVLFPKQKRERGHAEGSRALVWSCGRGDHHDYGSNEQMFYGSNEQMFGAG
jgi:hypothetical protein